METTPTTKHHGSCHCGAVRFDVDLDLGKGASRCNCSACTKTGTTTAIVQPAAFVLVAGEDALGTYEWGRKTARRLFCKTCGITCFGRGYLEQLGGDYVSINLNCVDDIDVRDVAIVYFDGRHDNWMGGPRSTPWPVFTTSTSR